MCRDNSHHLLKYFLGICLCSISISLLHASNLLQNGLFLFSAYFGGHFCYHSNRKSRINARLLHFGYCSNKLIRRNLWRVTFICWPHRGAKIAFWCTYPFDFFLQQNYKVQRATCIKRLFCPPPPPLWGQRGPTNICLTCSQLALPKSLIFLFGWIAHPMCNCFHGISIWRSDEQMLRMV